MLHPYQVFGGINIEHCFHGGIHGTQFFGGHFPHRNPVKEIGDFEVAAAYQVYNANAADPLEEDVKTFGVSLAYDAKVVKVAADYSVAEKDNTPAEDLTFINAVVTIPVNKMTKANIGMQMIELDNVAASDATAWYANITHKLNKEVSVFAEITDSDIDQSDMGYLAGMRMKF